MKSLTRITMLALLFLLASTAAFADIFTIGSLDLNNVLPGSSDEFDLTNLTGPGGPGTQTPLTFENLSLTINGSIIAISTSTLGDGGFEALAQNLLVNSITSFSLTGTILESTAMVNGVEDNIVQSFSVLYNGPALDASAAPVHFDVNTSGIPVGATPEPASLTLFGSGLVAVSWLFRRRSLKA